MFELNDVLKEKIKDGLFGLERECIRVDEDGVLSHLPHPEVFGDKFLKKHITTDFSESQIEMITPALKNVEETYEYASKLYDYVCSNIGEEFLWCNSMPCIIEGEIPVAFYSGEEGKKATEYRKMLIQRYGGEKQLISGIHFNFSFIDEFLVELYRIYGKGKDYQLFVDDIYLKIARNYFKYGFAISFLCGASPSCHDSFDKKCLAELKKTGEHTFEADGVSLRNSKWGYRNLYDLFPSYYSAKKYVESIGRFIDEGKISFFKEYYSDVRLKGRTRNIEDIKDNGISYIEIRSIDINPFDKAGVSLLDLKFVHCFLLLMLFMEEEGDCRECYQKNGIDAKERVALFGLDQQIFICEKPYSAKKKILELIDRAAELNRELGLYSGEVFEVQRQKVKSGGYADKFRGKDFVKESVKLMKGFKEEALRKAADLTDEEVKAFNE